MTKGKPRDARKEQQWRQWIQSWQASGQSVQAFCARHGLAQANFYVWRRELQRRGFFADQHQRQHQRWR